MCERGGHSGGGVGLGDGDLLGFAGLFSTVGTEALTFQHRGTSAMESVRDADVWLALHEGPLHKEKHSLCKQNIMLLSDYVYTHKNYCSARLVSLKPQFIAAVNDSLYYQLIC